MGGILSSPKTPTPPPLPPAPEEPDQDKLTEERLKRQRAAGTSKNVVSSLAGAKSDTETVTRVSKLLG